MNEYDETKAVAFINSRLEKQYPDDEILNVIDMIWDYYESNGMFEIDDDDDEPEDDLEEQLVEYVKKMLVRDSEANVAMEDVADIVKAELEYEESLYNAD